MDANFQNLHTTLTTSADVSHNGFSGAWFFAFLDEVLTPCPPADGFVRVNELPDLFIDWVRDNGDAEVRAWVSN